MGLHLCVLFLCAFRGETKGLGSPVEIVIELCTIAGNEPLERQRPAEEK